MILIVDGSGMRRSLALRDRFFAAGVPCALCTYDKMTELRDSIVTIYFAPDDRSLSLAAVRAGKTALIAVNVSGRRMSHMEAVIWDEKPDDALVRFAIDLAKEKCGVDVYDVVAGDLRVTSDAANIGLKHLALSENQRLIVLHLALHAGRYCPESEVRRFALPNGDMRKKSSPVKVLVFRINEKAMMATGERLISCKRGSGYALLNEEPKEKRKYERRGYVPPFC